MSLKLLLDEDLASKVLVTLLQSDGHDVRTVYDEGLAGAEDADVLSCAHENQRILLTRNTKHFQRLHESLLPHSGIIAIYQNTSSKKNLGHKDVLRAISNIENADFEIAGQFISLNAWSY